MATWKKGHCGICGADLTHVAGHCHPGIHKARANEPDVELNAYIHYGVSRYDAHISDETKQAFEMFVALMLKDVRKKSQCWTGGGPSVEDMEVYIGGNGWNFEARTEVK